MGFKTQGEFEMTTPKKCTCGQRQTTCVMGTGQCMKQSIQHKRTLKLDKQTVQKKENVTLNLFTNQLEKST